MGATSYQQSSFLGGEWSKSSQGRTDRPDYRTALNVCLNTIPTEGGAAQRRPGTRHCGLTRRGANGRVLSFDFKQPFPYTLEITDGFLRFWNETVRAETNDAQTVTAISAANPAVVTTQGQHGWASGNTSLLKTNMVLLQNRPVIITVLSPTTFSIADEITGLAINGAGLGAFTSGTASRVHEVASPYVAETWKPLRAIQAETTAVLVMNSTAPQVLSVTAEPSDTQFANFALSPASFLDGPYLDPVKGSYITSSALNGVVTLTLSFQAYDAGKAYNIGDYVTSSGAHYKSRTANNQAHTPASSPANWAVVNAGDPYNDGAGIVSADIGRLVRLLNEPQIWAAATTYAAGQAVAYPDSNGGWAYYVLTAGAAVSGDRPGTTTRWAPDPTLAVWTWGPILSISTSGAVTPGTPFGDMTGGGGLAAAFDGNTSKSFASCANVTSAIATKPRWLPYTLYYAATSPQVQYQGTIYIKTHDDGGFNEFLAPPGNPLWTAIGTVSNAILTQEIGLHYGAPTIISQVTVYPSTDVGLHNGSTVTLNLRGKATLPANSGDGTLLASSGAFVNTFSPWTLVSSDQLTAYSYVWIEVVAGFYQPLYDDGSHVFTCKLGIAQVSVTSPNIANGSVFTVQIAGPPLQHNLPCRTWRLGAYGGTNGYPTCGTYHDSRLWLSGVIGNRADSSKTLTPDAIAKGIFDFAPTSPQGVVADDNAIAAIFTAKNVNTIFWMEPDQQGILCGTQKTEWLISPSAPGAMSPTNTSAHPVTSIGCADIEPRRTDHTLVFVQKFGRKVMEFFPDVYSGKFSAPSLSKDSEHLTVTNVMEIAYQQEKTSIVWMRLGNGKLAGITYQRDSLTSSKGPDIAGAHRHTHGAARLIRSMCVGGSTGGNLDSLTMVTEAPEGGAFHVEIMTDLLDEGFALTDVWHVDDGIIPASFTIDETAVLGAPYGGVNLYGLWPHNGKTVSAWLIGLDCGDYTVANGAIFVPFGDGVSAGSGGGLFTAALARTYLNTGLDLPMAVGFPYVSDGQCVRPARPEETSLPHPALGDTRRTQSFAALLYGAVSGKIKFGTEFASGKMFPADFSTKGGTKYTAQQLFDGVHQGPITADSDFDNMICWRIERPHPAFIIALAGALHTQGR